jgi:hypothetical protein
VGITFSHLSLSYWIDYLGFITEGKLAAIFIKTFSWGFPTGRSFYFINSAPSSFLALLPGTTKKKKKLPHQLSASKTHQVFCRRCRGERRLLRGEFSHAHPLLCFKFCFTLFLLASFYQKPKKTRILGSCYFFTLVHYVVP